MTKSNTSLAMVYEGWDGYRESIVLAVTPLTGEQLMWRPAAHLRSAGEIARHIALGSINWFLRMGAPGSQTLASQIKAWEQDPHGNQYVIESALEITDQASKLVNWLKASGQMIDETLRTWTVDDLDKTYRHIWRGNAYAVSRQWTLWRIMAHDLHHGGELALLLGMQGLENFELGDLGGHIKEPALADQM